MAGAAPAAASTAAGGPGRAGRARKGLRGRSAGPQGGVLLHHPPAVGSWFGVPIHRPPPPDPYGYRNRACGGIHHKIYDQLRAERVKRARRGVCSPSTSGANCRKSYDFPCCATPRGSTERSHRASEASELSGYGERSELSLCERSEQNVQARKIWHWPETLHSGARPEAARLDHGAKRPLNVATARIWPLSPFLPDQF